MTSPLNIGLLVGSFRQRGNWTGLNIWLTNQLNQIFNSTTNNSTSTSASLPSSSSTAATHYKLLPIFPFSPSHPVGPVLSPVIPAAIGDTSQYPDGTIQSWSRTVNSCVGFVILTPQYNWGYPGELKNALDQLFGEWKNKAVMLVTYGGRGGGKCGQQLIQVLMGGMKMRVITERVEIVLPSDYIAGTKRVTDTELQTSNQYAEMYPWLIQYEAGVSKATQQLIQLIQDPSAAGVILT